MAHDKPRQTPQSLESVRKRTLWQSYAVLPAKTRLKISLAVCTVAIAGIFVSDSLERATHPPPKQNTKNPE